MSNTSTLASREKSKIFETIFSSPGMTEKCKIFLHSSRQNILLLARLIEYGLLTQELGVEDEIISSIPKESQEQFREIHSDILAKAGLADFYEKLKSL